MGHDHGHAVGRAEDRSRLRIALAITVVVLVVEVVGAWVAGSLALLADAGHVATDAGALVLALGASYVAALPAGPRSTFGYHRAEVLAALANAVLLLAVSAFLAYAGTRRLVEPSSVDAAPMVAFALVGLLANGLALAVLSRSGTGSINMRGAATEVLGDLVGSGLAVVAGLVIWTTGFDRADAIASLLIAVLIVPRAYHLLRDATAVLLEVAPEGVDLAEIEGHLRRMPGVVDVHDLHAWTITSGMASLSAHVAVTDDVLAERGVGAILDELTACLADHFDLRHVTFQVEPTSHQRHEDLGQPH